MTLWRDFDERQSAWFQRILNVLRSTHARPQAQLPRFLAGFGLYAAEDVAPCAHVSSLVQSSDVRAAKRRHAPTKESIFADDQPLIDALQLSFAAA